MKHLIIINPKAGVKDNSNKIIEEIKKVFANEEYTYYLTKGKKDATVYVKEYLKNNSLDKVRIYACGGDGTLNEVVNGAYGYSNAEVTCYPNGSGNDFLKTFGKLEKFMNFENLKNGEIHNVDLIKFNDHFVLNIFNVGLDAKVVVKHGRIKKWPLVSGKMAYNLGLVSAFFGRIRDKYKLVVDDKVVFEGKGILCAIANGVCYGGGYYCAPNATVEDGMLDVCLVKNISRIKFLRMVGDYKKGNHLDKPKIRKHIVYEKCQKVHLEVNKELPYSVDGELGYSNSVDLEIVPSAIKFAVPSK